MSLLDDRALLAQVVARRGKIAGPWEGDMTTGFWFRFDLLVEAAGYEEYATALLTVHRWIGEPPYPHPPPMGSLIYWSPGDRHHFHVAPADATPEQVRALADDLARAEGVTLLDEPLETA